MGADMSAGTEHDSQAIRRLSGSITRGSWLIILLTSGIAIIGDWALTVAGVGPVPLGILVAVSILFVVTVWCGSKFYVKRLARAVWEESKHESVEPLLSFAETTRAILADEDDALRVPTPSNEENFVRWSTLSTRLLSAWRSKRKTREARDIGWRPRSPSELGSSARRPIGWRTEGLKRSLRTASRGDSSPT